MKKILGITTCIVLAVSVTLAGNRSGAVTAQFLKLPVNARATAMGNAQVVLAEGATSMAFNPAGILTTQQFSFGGTYNRWWADITHGYFGLAYNLPDIGTIGGGVLFLTTDDMNVRTPLSPEGTGEIFKAAEYAVNLSFSRQITDQFGLGLTGKYIKSNLYNEDINANTFAFDVGTLYDIPVLRTRLGIAITNLGNDLTYLTETYSIPTTLRFGARVTAYEEGLHRAYVAFQIGRPNDADEQYNLGAEYTFQDLLSIRGGYKFNYDTENWTAGAGVKLNSLGINGGIDYSYSNYEFLPATHMFTLDLGF